MLCRCRRRTSVLTALVKTSGGLRSPKIFFSLMIPFVIRSCMKRYLSSTCLVFLEVPKAFAIDLADDESVVTLIDTDLAIRTSCRNVLTCSDSETPAPIP